MEAIWPEAPALRRPRILRQWWRGRPARPEAVVPLARPTAGGVVIELHGRTTCDALAAAAGGAAEVTVDVSRLAHVDNVTLSAIVSLLRRRSGMRVVGMSPRAAAGLERLRARGLVESSPGAGPSSDHGPG